MKCANVGRHHFLLAAGEIDRLSNDHRAKTCRTAQIAAGLESLSGMNGAYLQLDPGFRQAMRTATGKNEDDSARTDLGRLAKVLRQARGKPELRIQAREACK